MKKINYLLMGLAGFFVAGFLFMAVVVFRTSIQSLSSRNIKSEINMFKTEETEFLKIKKTYREWQQAESSYSRLTRDYLFPFAEFSTFRHNFESFLSRNSLKAVGLDYKIENQPDGIARLIIGFQTAGSYPGFKKFIFDLEQAPEIVFFKEIELDRQKDGVLAKVNLEAYFVR